MEDLPTRLLEIQVESGSAVRLTGDIDSHTAPDLESALDELPKDRDAVLELEGVSFIDSSGLRVVVAAHQQFEDAGKRLVLKSPSNAVTRLLEIAGLLGTFHIDSL